MYNTFTRVYNIWEKIRKTTLLPLDELLEVVNAIGIKITRSALIYPYKGIIYNLRKLISLLDEKT